MTLPYRALFQAVAAKFVEERRALQPQHACGLALVAPGPKESSLEQSALDLDVGATQ
jgi:hypothetical protein